MAYAANAPAAVPSSKRALERGFLKAANSSRIKFCLMWANHDWIIQPAKRNGGNAVLYPGAVTARTFDTMTDYIVKRYFRHPAHWTIDGRSYFSIYELFRRIEGDRRPAATSGGAGLGQHDV